MSHARPTASEEESALEQHSSDEAQSLETDSATETEHTAEHARRPHGFMGGLWAVLRPLNRLRRRFGQRWSSSLQLRTAVYAAGLTLGASFIMALFLTHQITTGLYQSRFTQLQAEASHGLEQAEQIFENAATADQESTSTLVTETLGTLGGDGDIAGSNRDFVLIPLEDEDAAFVGSMTSAGISPDMISDDLAQQVAEGDGVYYQPATLTAGSETSPAIAFGTKVVLPPGNYYGLYFIYDLSEVQYTLDYLMNVLLLAGLILVLINVAIAIVVTRSVTRPVQVAAQSAEAISSGDLSVRMEVKRHDEVSRLSESFNKMADNIEDQITQLAELSAVQQRFVSDVSHELRTPLTTVRMAAEVLYDSRDEFDQINRRSTELMYHQVERFQTLLADLLEISRFDAGAAQIQLESTDMLQLGADVLLTAQPLADSNNTELSLVIIGQRDFQADVDSRRIERILRNLVNNAIEHGESNPVDLIIASNDDAISVVVRDHGLGISPEQVEHVFDRFWRADPARTRTTGGSGLGLSIATEDTHLHNGVLDVWGELGEGAAFRLNIPRHQDLRLTEPYPLPLPPEYSDEQRRSAMDVEPSTETFTAPTDRINEQALYPQNRPEGSS